MKKNKAMRLASCLLVLTLLTACMISGAFAKYVSSDTTTDEAKVAKWGVTAKISGSLFGKAYNKESATDGNEIAASSDNVSSNTDKVVAPGTQNTKGMVLSVTGTPEVANKVTVEKPDGTTNSDIYLRVGKYGILTKDTSVSATTPNITDYYYLSGGSYVKATSYAAGTDYYKLMNKVEVKNNDYYPVKWTFTKTGSTPGTQYSDTAALFTGITNIFGSSDNNAGVALNLGGTITWEWPIGTASEDGVDTILGKIISGGSEDVVVKTTDEYVSCKKVVKTTDYSTDLAFNIKLAVTQVD